MNVDLMLFLDLPPARAKPLTDAGYILHKGARPEDRAEAVEQAGGRIRAALTTGTRGLTAAEIEMLPNLEIICAMGAGFEGIDLAAARARNIVVTHGPNTNAETVADSAMMMLMATARRLPQADHAVRTGRWTEWRVPGVPTISNKKLGILGLGNIGTRIAKRAADGFDMEVGYHSRRRVEGSAYRYFDRLIDLAAWADFLVVATPGGAETYHMVNTEVLTALGPRGYLVNIGRGSVVDIGALIDALKAGRIAGAGLDVLEGEPKVPPELIELNNVVLTPHYAGRSPEALAATIELVLQNLEAHFGGKPVLTPVAAMAE